MRTTVDIDEETLSAIKAIAKRRKISVSKLITSMLQRSLAPKASRVKIKNGFPQLTIKQGVKAVTPETVDRLLEADLEDSALG